MTENYKSFLQITDKIWGSAVSVKRRMKKRDKEKGKDTL